MTAVKKNDIIGKLQADILRLQGFRQRQGSNVDLRLGVLKNAFPDGIFPVAAVHEFISASIEDHAATSGFVSGLLSGIIQENGCAVWINTSSTIFPPALAAFDIRPDRIIFVRVKNQREALWVLEEALKCKALSAVIAEIRELSFTESRRLQLAVEESQVTGLVLRNTPRMPGTTACVSRWRVTSLPGVVKDDLPGLGATSWRVELLRIRNGRPNVTEVMWANGCFQPVPDADVMGGTENRKVG